jgi:hypothetical protein
LADSGQLDYWYVNFDMRCTLDWKVSQMTDDIDVMIEIAVGDLYKNFMRLRKAERYQDEYDAMGTLLNMLSTDRQFLRTKYKVKP